MPPYFYISLLLYDKKYQIATIYTIIINERYKYGGIKLLENIVEKILDVITEKRIARNWSEYQLAERAELPQSTISSWYRKKIAPTIFSLEKICNAFGITLSELFAETGSPVSLTESQVELLKMWTKLNEKQQAAFLQLMDSI